MSLHTTYRPQTWNDVLGQDATVRSLKKVVKEKRSHAFIFCGPSGTGKTTLARILAREFNGSDAGVVNLDETDAASKSGANDIRALVNSSLYRAIGGSPNKFFIIDEAQRLSSTAWDVLLKPVEEPPAHVYYAFCTTEMGKIPKTIITRCLKYDLKPVKEELILGLLCKVADAEKFDTSDEILEAIAENCGGSPRQALVYLEACLAAKTLAEAHDLMRTAGLTKNVADLGRWLIGGKGHTWIEATKYLKALDGEPESVRIQLMRYFTVVLTGCKSDKAAVNILRLVECFKNPYYSPDGFGPLYYSVGLAIKLDQ